MSKFVWAAVAALSLCAAAGCTDRGRNASGTASNTSASAATTPAAATPTAGSAAAPARDPQRDLTALTSDDLVRRSTGAYYDTVDVTIPEGGSRINVRMTAFGFLPRMELLTQSQEPLFEAEGLNLNTSNLSTASLNEQLEPGRYVLVLTSARPNTLGTYSVDLAEETQTPLM